MKNTTIVDEISIAVGGPHSTATFTADQVIELVRKIAVQMRTAQNDAAEIIAVGGKEYGLFNGSDNACGDCDFTDICCKEGWNERLAALTLGCCNSNDLYWQEIPASKDQ